MTERGKPKLQEELGELPVHGPSGRIAHVREVLGMRQVDFASAIGVSREIVSRWENLRPDGTPKSRARRKHARAIVELVYERLGERLLPGTFFDPKETALDSVVAELQRVKQELERLQVAEGPHVHTTPAISVSWEGSDDELLEAKQAAALLTVEPATLHQWAREGRIPCIRLADRVVRWTRPMLREIRDRAVCAEVK